MVCQLLGGKYADGERQGAKAPMTRYLLWEREREREREEGAAGGVGVVVCWTWAGGGGSSTACAGQTREQTPTGPLQVLGTRYLLAL